MPDQAPKGKKDILHSPEILRRTKRILELKAEEQEAIRKLAEIAADIGDELSQEDVDALKGRETPVGAPAGNLCHLPDAADKDSFVRAAAEKLKEYARSLSTIDGLPGALRPEDKAHFLNAVEALKKEALSWRAV